MSMADLDFDGDLDVVINNLATPARLFENRLCGGDHLQIDLRWPEAPSPAKQASTKADLGRVCSSTRRSFYRMLDGTFGGTIHGTATGDHSRQGS